MTWTDKMEGAWDSWVKIWWSSAYVLCCNFGSQSSLETKAFSSNHPVASFLNNAHLTGTRALLIIQSLNAVLSTDNLILYRADFCSDLRRNGFKLCLRTLQSNRQRWRAHRANTTLIGLFITHQFTEVFGESICGQIKLPVAAPCTVLTPL